MKVNIKRLTLDARIPTYADGGAAGADLYASEGVTIHPWCREMVSTGIAIELPASGVYARIAPRSGLAVRHGIDVLAGVVDPSYRGDVKVVLMNNGEHDVIIRKGDRIAQLILERYEIAEFVECDCLGDTERGDGGFGSSGV